MDPTDPFMIALFKAFNSTQIRYNANNIFRSLLLNPRNQNVIKSPYYQGILFHLKKKEDISNANTKSFIFNKLNYPNVDFTKPLHTQSQEVVRRILPNMMKSRIKANVSETAAYQGLQTVKYTCEQ